MKYRNNKAERVGYWPGLGGEEYENRLMIGVEFHVVVVLMF